MKKRKWLITLLGAMLLLTACGKDYYNASDANTSAPPYRELIKGELYYIPHRIGMTDFPVYYEAFLKDHPELEVFDVEGDPDESQHNGNDGVFIFTKAKKSETE